MERFIKDLHAIQIYDSRGNPTIKVNVELDDGTIGSAMVPSGASTGKYEAVELRDNDMQEFNGLGVDKAVENVNKKIARILKGKNIVNQDEIDYSMIELDGTKNKAKLGANAILGVSLAVARTAALSINMPLYRYIGGISGNKMPVPLMNILNGGRHSDNNLNIQEFMIIPTGGSDFKECMQIGTEIYHVLKEILKKNNIMTSVGDEGGFSPNLSDDEEAIQLIVKAIEESGYKAGKDVSIGLDLASSEMREAAKKIEKEGYYFWKTKEYKTKDEMIEYIENLTKKFPITSIEDGLAEDDWKAWRDLTTKLGRNIQLVGDDLFVTSKERLKKGIQNKVANAILIKPNQIGTLTETLETIKLARASKYSTIISHRSGETEDTFIADLAVAVNAGQIKTGAPCRTERVCKYNRLLEIENDQIV